MSCPGEFICAVFAEGELPESQALEVSLHIESCKKCEELVRAFRRESDVLAQALQDIVLLESHETARPALSPAGLAVGVFGIAAALRIVPGVLLGLKLPQPLEWLDPRHLSARLGMLASVIRYAIEHGGVYMISAIQTLTISAIAALILFLVFRTARRLPVSGAILGVILACAVLSPSAYAIDVRQGPNPSVPAGMTVEDTVILIGDTIHVDGDVDGDVLAFGRVVTVTGNISGDLITGGQTVDIRGRVNGNVFSGAETIQVEGELLRNLYGYARAVSLRESARVGMEATTFAANVTVDGIVGRDMNAFAGMLDLRGTVGRNVAFRGGRVSVLGPARVGGALTAHVDDEESVRIDPTASVGSSDVRIRPPAPSRFASAGFYVWQCVRIVVLFLTGVVLFWLFPVLQRTSSVISRDWLRAGALGFAGAVVIPVATIVLMITVVGFLLGLSLLALCLAALMVAKIFVADFVGRAFVREGRFMPLLVGLVLIVIAINIPYVGFLINALLTLLGFGALLVLLYRLYSDRQLPEPAASPL